MSISSPTPETALPSGRFAEAVARMRRRSRLILFLRKALPAAILMLGLVIAGWMVVRTIRAFLSDLTRSAAVIHVTNPRFYGQDDHGRSFVIAAREAQRSLRVASDVKLLDPDLKFAGAGDRSMHVTARVGHYEDATKRKSLQIDVAIVSGDGTTFHTQQAMIDIRSGAVVGNSPIQGSGPLGQIQASSYAIYHNGSEAVFKGQVHAHLIPRSDERPGREARTDETR
jgi:lipopolysaccharide export system protein LptC